MISEKYIKVLKIILKKLGSTKINWAVGGSTSQALQGLDIDPKDIDILTDKNGAFMTEKLLKEFLTEAVEYRKSEKFKSYFSIFLIEGIKVEIMGEIINKLPEGNLWGKNADLHQKVFINFGNIKIPVIPLEQEYLVNIRMGRMERAERIKEVLDKKR